MEFLHPAMWHDHDIDFARWLHPAMWHVAVESWQWIHQVAAPCNVIRGCGIMTLNSPGGSTLQCSRWLWDDMPWNSPNVRHIEILHLVSILTISPQSTCHSAPVCEILSKSDRLQQKKMTSCQFSRWRISAVLDIMDLIMGSLKSPCTTSYRSSIETIALNYLVFEKSHFCILATDKQMDRPIALSRSHCRKRRLKKWNDPLCYWNGPNVLIYMS